ncbi:hypothetical protein D3C75_1246580 [compost metagenome]
MLVYPTPKGLELEGTIRQASANLKRRYTEILGEQEAALLNSDILLTSAQLEKKA